MALVFHCCGGGGSAVIATCTCSSPGVLGIHCVAIPDCEPNSYDFVSMMSWPSPPTAHAACTEPLLSPAACSNRDIAHDHRPALGSPRVLS
jgi:hypothetical protein